MGERSNTYTRPYFGLGSLSRFFYYWCSGFWYFALRSYACIIYVAVLSAKFKHYSYCTTDSFLFFPLLWWQTPLTRCACLCPWSHFYLTWMLNSILVCLILPAQRFWISLLLLNLRSQNLKLNHSSMITSALWGKLVEELNENGKRTNCKFHMKCLKNVLLLFRKQWNPLSLSIFQI